MNAGWMISILVIVFRCILLVLCKPMSVCVRSIRRRAMRFAGRYDSVRVSVCAKLR